mgnify:CR=1 FL=1
MTGVQTCALPISFNLPSAIEFEWDFFGTASSLTGDEEDWSAYLISSNEGSVYNYEVPEPAGIGLIALVGLFGTVAIRRIARS